MTKLYILIAAATLVAAPSFADTQVSVTGPRGGTAEATRDCSAGGGAVSCSRSGTYTGPEGRTVSRETETTRSRDGGSRTTERTGPRGRTGTVTVERSR